MLKIFPNSYDLGFFRWSKESHSVTPGGYGQVPGVGCREAAGKNRQLQGNHFHCACGAILILELDLCRMSQLLGDVSLEGPAGRRAVLSYLSVNLISELESAVPVDGI